MIGLVLFELSYYLQLLLSEKRVVTASMVSAVSVLLP